MIPDASPDASPSMVEMNIKEIDDEQLHDVTDKEFEHDLRYERLFKEFFYLTSCLN